MIKNLYELYTLFISNITKVINNENIEKNKMTLCNYLQTTFFDFLSKSEKNIIKDYIFI